MSFGKLASAFIRSTGPLIFLIFQRKADEAKFLVAAITFHVFACFCVMYQGVTSWTSTSIRNIFNIHNLFCTTGWKNNVSFVNSRAFKTVILCVISSLNIQTNPTKVCFLIILLTNNTSHYLLIWTFSYQKGKASRAIFHTHLIHFVLA